MSATEIENISVFPPDKFVAGPDGVTMWRASFQRLTIHHRAEGGKTLCAHGLRGEEVRFELSDAEAEHLAALLTAKRT